MAEKDLYWYPGDANSKVFWAPCRKVAEEDDKF